ncbi:apolipoprotein N-acyltransferase [Sphingomonas oligophenolica]|uniref:Apolipoprotein N-acyltransferase n=1 Tax=Sphingomonas oligophenolica TaxID=301154 RepID=A0A502CKP8_9SPHN|nr:apolipoprotein N-acyltransferase [Sphingomonas oligophenolica]TPG12346.1 apolipoprotein N-acyltransferase [Sphingomonas oligophenolica]
MDRVYRYPALASLVLGAIAATGFAPLQLWPLTLLGFAGWIALVHRAPSLRQALWLGWAFGVGHFTINNNWVQHAFDFQDKMPPVLGYFAAVGLALYLAVYPAMAAGLAWRLGRRGSRVDLAYLLLFGAVWILTEWLRAVVFTGYAWDPIGVVWVAVIGVARVSAWIGTYALSGLTIVAAGSLLLVRRQVAVPAGIAAAIALAALSAVWTDAPPPARSAPRLRVVQPNIDNNLRGRDGGDFALRALINGSGTPGPVPRLVMWPEGLIDDFIESGYPDYVYARHWPDVIRTRIARALGPRDVLLTSASTLTFDALGEVSGAGNSVLAITPDAQIAGRYDKAHLVPYGEYLPIPWLLKPLGLARLVPGDMDFTPGPGPSSIVLPGFGAIGIQVCYEIVFSGQIVDEAHRPRMIFNPSNDAWFGSWGPPQHLAQARMRAIEEGLPIVRSTPTGISAVIASDGRLLATVPHHRAGAIDIAMPPALVPTLFARIGNWMALMVGLAMLILGVAIRRRAR